MSKQEVINEIVNNTVYLERVLDYEFTLLHTLEGFTFSDLTNLTIDYRHRFLFFKQLVKEYLKFIGNLLCFFDYSIDFDQTSLKELDIQTLEELLVIIKEATEKLQYLNSHYKDIINEKTLYLSLLPNDATLFEEAKKVCADHEKWNTLYKRITAI